MVQTAHFVKLIGGKINYSSRLKISFNAGKTGTVFCYIAIQPSSIEVHIQSRYKTKCNLDSSGSFFRNNKNEWVFIGL